MENSSEQKNVSQASQDDEISLIDLFAVLLEYKKLIILITVFVAAAALSFSVLSLILPTEKSPLPNIYTSEALMLINDSSSSGGSLSSMLSSSGMSGLSSLMGLANLSKGSTFSALAVYIAGTNTYLDAIIDKFDLTARYKIKKFQKAETRKALKKYLTAEFDDKSGVFSLAFSDTDPVFAESVANFAADYMETVFTSLGIDKHKLEKKNLEENIDISYRQILSLAKQIRENENAASYRYNPDGSLVVENALRSLELSAQEQVYKQLKTQYELLKVQMASETPVFQILERAEVPDRKSKPSRGKLCIIATFAAFFISVFIAFALNAVENIKRDPEAVKKLSASLGKNRK
ncbi:lipopolysaccharide biosynthesis protein [Treponema sp. Marseille-Q4130]|uniref:lipopolysaccharide biosynthesis protein n=1 Tax=Treponema sp. Marseille-Q4130 TaxID=2766702 RepID=UPI0016524A23|nr:lipopolysaccharide biosynthesis protein [Treponema sp. Marseille-Q4130]MBC6719884.1 lipopolysaccharide biosynthesis protein [Treponema sp. Marseille-Q4130]